MEIQTEHLKRCDLITLKGRFDSNTAPELDKALRASIEAGVYHLALDLREVDYFGSAAIRALISAYKECRRWNRGDVRLAGISENVRRVLDLAGISSLIQIYHNPTEAVGSF